MKPTKQQYYDLLVKTSAEGGFPSLNTERDACRYRGTNGKKCAVGLIMPDEVYCLRMEGQLAMSACELAGNLDWIPEGMTPRDLVGIQRAHDWECQNLIFGDADGVVTPWSHARFVANLNNLSCFADVVRQEV